MAKKYRKKPAVVEAFQIDIDPAPSWFMQAVAAGRVEIHSTLGGALSAEIETLEGRHCANPKDYIIRGVKGEIYPCKPDIFAMTYEEVSDG